MNVERKVERIMATIDREGESPLPLSAWIEMLTQIRSECQSRLQAAKEDARRSSPNSPPFTGE